MVMRIGYDAKRVLRNFTGLGNYSRFVISNMKKNFPENHYLMFVEKRSYPEKLEEEFKKDDDYVTNDRQAMFWRSWQVIKDIQRTDIEIYHGLSGELPFRIHTTKAKSVVTVHDLIFRRYPRFYSGIDRFIYNVKARYACRTADKIVAVSECTKRDIIRYYDVAPEKIEVVYQGCFPVFRQKKSKEEKEDVRKRHNLPERYLLSVGSLEERKNLLLVLKAIKDLPDIHLVAVGGQRSYAKKLKAYLSKHGLEDRVHLKSGIPLSDLPAIYQSAAVFVYPSLYEGFGIPIIEALSSGVPVIGATGSCLEEAGGPHSVYVDPHDAKELARQINRILSDKSLADTMIDEGYRYVGRFADEACTARLMAVYKRLL